MDHCIQAGGIDEINEENEYELIEMKEEERKKSEMKKENDRMKEKKKQASKKE